jgi:hypothetical protein
MLRILRCLLHLVLAAIVHRLVRYGRESVHRSAVDVMLWRTDRCWRVGLGSLVTRDGRILLPTHRCLGSHVVVGFYGTRQTSRPTNISYAWMHMDNQNTTQCGTVMMGRVVAYLMKRRTRRRCWRCRDWVGQ